MRRYMKSGLAIAAAATGAMTLALSGPARADLALAASCSGVPLSSEYDRAAAAAALPTFVGINQICAVQALLATVGTLPGSREVDGRYDRQTRNALKAFQSANGLASNGLLTPSTMDILAGAALDQIFSAPEVATAAEPEPAMEEEIATPASDLAEATTNGQTEPSISETIDSLKLATPEAVAVLELAKTQPTIELPGAANPDEALAPAKVVEAVETATQTDAAPVTEMPLEQEEALAGSGSTPTQSPATPSTANGGVPASATLLTDEEIAALVQEAMREGKLNDEPLVIRTTTTTTQVGSTGGVSAAGVELETSAREVIRDPLADSTVSSFVEPSICHAPSSAQDRDLARNLSRLPVGTCLRTFVGAGNLPYRLYSLEVLADGPTLVLLHDDDDTSFDAAVTTLNTFGGRLVVMQSNEQTQTTILGANPEIMTVSPSSNAGCKWAEEERPLAFAVHDYIVAGSKPVIVLRRNTTQRAVLDLFSDGKFRFDRSALGPARELFVPSNEPLADNAFIELMVTSATRRSIQTRGIIRTGVQYDLPVALTLVDALGRSDQCSVEALSLQTDLPVLRVLLGESQDVASQMIIAAAFNAVGFNNFEGGEPVSAENSALSLNDEGIPASVLALAAGGLDADLREDLVAPVTAETIQPTRSLTAALAPGLPPLPLGRPGGTTDPLFAGATELASTVPIGRRTTGIAVGSGVDALAPVAIGGADGALVSTQQFESVIIEEAVGPVTALPPSPILRPISDVLYRFVPDNMDPILAMDGNDYYATAGRDYVPTYDANGQLYDPNAQPRVISSRTIHTTVPTNPYAVPNSGTTTYTEVPTIYIQQQPVVGQQGAGGVSGPLYGTNGQNLYAPQPQAPASLNETIIINNSIY